MALTLHYNYLRDAGDAIGDSVVTGPTPTFTRASSGTYFDESGVLVSASSDAPRFDHDPANGNAPLGLLIEEARTNLLLRSEQLDDTWWTKRGGTSLVVTANDAPAPDGNTTADKIENVGASGVDDLTSGAITVGADVRYEPSFWIKRITTTGSMRVSNPQTSARGRWALDMSALGDGWERITRDHPAVDIQVEFIGTAGGFGGLKFDSVLGGGPYDFHLWGLQAEIGTFPTSYIPTVSTAVTRAADVLSTTTLTWLNANAGTLFAQASIPYAGTVERSLITIDDGTATDRLRLYMDAAENINFETVNSGDTDGASDGTAVIAVNTVFRAAGAYTDDDVIGCVDTTLSAADSAAGLPVTDTATTLRIGNDSAGTPFNGHIQEVRYYDTRQADGDLQTLTDDIDALTGSAAQGIQGPTQSGTGEEFAAGTAAQSLPAVNQIATGFEVQTRYVDKGGHDGNSGLSSLLPWKTISKVNGETFNPGDIISLNKGDEWWETLRPPSAGSSGSRITFTAHGAGANPIINSIDAFRYNHRDSAEYDESGLGHNVTAGWARNGLFKAHSGDDLSPMSKTENGTTSSVTYSETEGFPMAVLYDGDGYAQLTDTWYLTRNQRLEVEIECKSDGVGEAFVRFYADANGLADSESGGIYSTFGSGSDLISALHIDDTDTDWTTKSIIIECDGTDRPVSFQLRTEVANAAVYVRAIRARPLWVNVSGDIWSAAYEPNQTGTPYMVSFDGVPTLPAADASVDAAMRWFMDGSIGTVHNGILYVYSPAGDPGASSENIAIATKTASRAYDGNDKTYITCDGLDFRNAFAVAGNFGANTTIQNSALRVGVYCALVDADNVTLEGILAEWGDWLINIGSVDSFTLRNSEVRGARKFAPSITNGEGGLVAPSVVAGGDCTNLLIELNRLHDAAAYGYAEFGTDASNRIEDAIVRRNLIWDVWFAIWTQALANGVSNSLIAYNIAHSPKASGDAVGGGSIATSCGYLHYRAGNTAKLYNNLLRGFATGIRGWNGELALDAQNNLVIDSIDHHVRTTDSGWTIANLNKNLYHSAGSPVWQYQGTTYNTLAEWQAAVEASAVGGDPLFVDAENGDFRVLAGSPALGAGADVGLTTDYLGNPISGTPTIGPFELPFITAAAALAVPAPIQVASGAEHLDGTSVQTISGPAQAAAGSAVLDVLGAAAQELASPAQAANGSETAAGTAALEAPAVTQVASGSETLAATAAQVLGGPAQAAAGGALSDTSGAAAQDLGGPVQAADGAERIGVTAAQAISAPAQAADGTSILDVAGTAAQTVNGPAQAAAGGETLAGAAGQTLSAPAQAASGGFGGDIAGAADQALDGPVQAVDGTAILDVAGAGAQGIPAPSLAAAGAERVDSAAAQGIPSPSQAAAGDETLAGSAGQDLDGPAQAADGTAILDLAGDGAQSLAGPAQAGDGTETVGGAASGQTVAAPRQAAAGDETAGGTSAQIIAFPVQAGTGGQSIGGTAAQGIPAPVQNSVGVEITGDPRVIGTLSGSVGRTELKGALWRAKLRGAA